MSKPFNLADAKLGHPVQTATHNVKLFAFDFQIKAITGEGVVGIADPKEGGFPTVGKWLPDGRMARGEANNAGHLVMAPVGTIDGKPVYPGDMICIDGSDPFPAPFGSAIEWQHASWPRQYPVTQMEDAQLAAAATSIPFCTLSLRAVADKAIRHGIDNGYLFDAAALEPLRAVWGDGLLADPRETFKRIAKDCIDFSDRMTALTKERDALLEMNSNQAATISAQPRYLRAIMQAGIVNGWHQAYDVGGIRIDCPKTHPEKLDQLIAQVK